MTKITRVFVEGNHKCPPGSFEYDNAEMIGYELAKNGFTVVSSAGKGVSEAVFSGAIRSNNDSKRIAIDCSEVNLERNSKFTDVIIADNYFDMKMRNCINSDAFIFLPGSFEVLSNLSIILQLKQLSLMGKKPVICVGEQLEEVLNIYGFYNEEVIDAFSEVILANNAEEATRKIIEIFR